MFVMYAINTPHDIGQLASYTVVDIEFTRVLTYASFPFWDIDCRQDFSRQAHSIVFERGGTRFIQKILTSKETQNTQIRYLWGMGKRSTGYAYTCTNNFTVYYLFFHYQFLHASKKVVAGELHDDVILRKSLLWEKEWGEGGGGRQSFPPHSCFCTFF